MTLHTAGTFYVPEGQSVTVSLPRLREGNSEGRVLLFHNRGEVYLPAYVEQADSDDLLLLNQYNADALVEAIRTRAKVLDEFDPAQGVWRIRRTESDELEVEHRPGVESLADAMHGDSGGS